MDRKTYDALVKSVAKWRKNVNVRHPFNAKTDAEDCPLCQLFSRNRCNGCPVDNASGKACGNTPFQSADEALMAWNNAAIFSWRANEFKPCKAEWRKTAQREADFLAALVPAGGPTE